MNYKNFKFKNQVYLIYIHIIEPFVHFLAQGVVVCSECKHAVLPSHVDAHLKDEEKHKAVKAN